MLSEQVYTKQTPCRQLL